MLGAGQEPRSDEDRRRLAGRLARYAALERAPSEAHGELHPGEGFPACEPPDIRTPPSFVGPYRRSILSDPIRHVDGSGSYGIGLFKIGASGGTSTTLSESTQVSLQQVSETARKSANSLKTLKKIDVHGVSESFVQDRSCCGTESLGTRLCPRLSAPEDRVWPAQSPRNAAQPAVIRCGEEGRDAKSA